MYQSIELGGLFPIAQAMEGLSVVQRARLYDSITRTAIHEILVEHSTAGLANVNTLFPLVQKVVNAETAGVWIYRRQSFIDDLAPYAKAGHLAQNEAEIVFNSPLEIATC